MLESLKDLYDAVKDYKADTEADTETQSAIDALLDYAKSIQDEVDYRYMELPLDGDGAPIHIGDKLIWSIGYETCEMIVGMIGSEYVGELQCGVKARICVHARTTQPLEDILSKELSEASRMDVGPDDPHIAALARSIRESVIEEIGYTVKKAIE